MAVGTRIEDKAKKCSDAEMAGPSVWMCGAGGCEESSVTSTVLMATLVLSPDI